MLVAVFGDAHAHAEALDAVVVAAERAGVDQLWSLGDMIGRGPDPEHVVKGTRERCAVALVGNHDYGATGSVDPLRFGELGSVAVQRAQLGLVAHTHQAAAWQQTPTDARRARIGPGEPLDISTGRWLLNPGAVGAPAPSRLSWWDALGVQAADGACWLLLDLKGRTATWRRAPYDPAPARSRARALGLDDGYPPPSSDARPKPSSLASGLR